VRVSRSSESRETWETRDQRSGIRRTLLRVGTNGVSAEAKLQQGVVVVARRTVLIIIPGRGSAIGPA